MSAIANITVKKNDGTTDIVYTAVVPSSGEGVPAVWKSQTIGNAPAHQPELRLSSRTTGANGNRRSLRSSFVYPQIATNSTTGITSVVDRLSITSDWVIPNGMATSDINEAVAQYANLLASALIKASVQSGYAPS